MSQITRFIADVFDIYPDSEFVKLFIVNKKLDVSSMLEHPLLNASMNYGFVWNTVYGTYPTRKDFAEFVDRVLINQQNPDIIKLAKQTIFLANNRDIPPITITPKAYLYNKWSYRYNTTIKSDKNLYELYNDIKSNYKDIENLEYIDKIGSNLIGFTEKDLQYMTNIEKIQFNLYKDLHFILKILNHVVVYVNDIQMPQKVFDGLVEAYKEPVLLLYNAKLELEHDIDFTYKVSKEFLYVFPKFTRTFILVSDTPLPTIAPLLQSINYSNKNTNLFPGYDRIISAQSNNYNSDIYPINLDHKYLSCKQFYLKYWGVHLNSGCPIRNKNVQFGTLLYWKFLHYYTLGIKVEKKTFNKKADNKAVIVDNRENVTSILSVLYALHNLDSSWGCKVYTSTDAVKYYKTHLDQYNVEVVAWPTLNVKRFHIDIYNSLLKSEEFWESIDSIKTLIIQDDGLLLRKGVEKFLEWDYIGCPWADCDENKDIKVNYIPNLVGNGGFSLRNTQLSKYICEKYKTEKKSLFYKRLVEIPEDVYFAACLYKEGAKIPTSAVAEHFGSEQLTNVLPLGIHKVWAYSMPEHVKKVLGSFL